MPRLTVLSGNSCESRRVFRRFFRERERLSTTRCSARNRAMHVEVRFYFASLFLKKHRQQKTGPEQFSDASEHLRTTTRPEWLRGIAVLLHQVAPHDHVSVFYFSETTVNVFLVLIRLRRGENAIEKCCIGF